MNPDVCDSFGECVDNDEPDNTPCDSDDNDCTSDVCESGVCMHNPTSDADDDNICDDDDNCPYDANESQTDTDKDGIGDACDNCPNTPNVNQSDVDEDNHGDVCDICKYNPQGYSTGCEDLRVHVRNDSLVTENQELHPYFRLKNEGTTSVSLGDLKLVYWYTYDAADDENNQVTTCWNIPFASCGNVSYAIAQLGSASTTYADNTWSWTINSSATLNAGAETGDLNAAMHTTNWRTYNFANDYSFENSTSYKETLATTLYRKNASGQWKLIWGKEPE